MFFLFIVRLNGHDAAVFTVIKLRVLNVSSVVDTARKLTVMIEKIPFSVILNDRVMSGPAKYRLHDLTLIGERTLGAVSH